MSRCLFIHDFFQDGRADVLAEVRELQIYGQWTKQKRANWTKQAITCYERSKRTHPLGSSYNAGRLSALRSAITARYPMPDPHGKMVFLSQPRKKTVICHECGEQATWKCHPDRNESLRLFLCDRCKQERVRTAVFTHASGWDWNKHEVQLLPLPVPQRTKLMQMRETDLELAQVTLPLGALFACDLSNVLWPTDHLSMLMELGIVLLVRWHCTHIARFFFFLNKLIEGEDS